MDNKFLHSSVTCLLLLISIDLFAQVYKWVDEDGNVHFGDSPRQDINAEDISQDVNDINISDSSDTGYSFANSNNPEQNKRESEQRATERAHRQEVCDEARERLSIISGRVYFTDENGDDLKISERERVVMAEELRADIKRHCG